jgi:hypothetical protein
MDIKNIDNLVKESLAIEREEAEKAGAIGFMARALIQATMPHSKVDGHEFKRYNGLFKMTMLADSDIGLPYGSIPRLLMSWITTEAVQTQSRELILGNNLSSFMEELGMIQSGGRWGTITRLKDQMRRLFSASISCSYDNGESWGIRNTAPVERADLWWDPKNPKQATMWESKLLLGDSFYQELIQHPVPIDMRALKALSKSPMAIDIYCWLTYRMSYLRKITSIPWSVLQVQFGSNYKDTRQFKRSFLNQLKKVLIVYPDAKVKEREGTLILFPSKTHISQRKQSVIQPPVAQPPIKTDLRPEYKSYQLSKVVEIVDTSKSKHEILKSFDNYLVRKNLNNIRSLIIKGHHNKLVKQELLHFIQSNWPDILEGMLSYSDFCNQSDCKVIS